MPGFSDSGSYPVSWNFKIHLHLHVSSMKIEDKSTSMFGVSLPAMFRPIAIASSSRSALASSSSSSSFASSSRLTLTSPIVNQVRFRSQLAPRRTKYRKSQKGRVSLPTVSYPVPQHQISREG